MSILDKDVYHGGVLQHNKNISSWQAVYNMIKLRGASLSKISYSSLTGFIFRLDIPIDKQNVEFYGLNDQKTALTKPIYNIVFKLAIISDDDNDKLGQLVIHNQSFNKKTEILESFREEANTQQQIYIDTLSPNGNPITLSIIDFSFFDKRSTADLLTELLNMTHNSGTVSEMLKYIESKCLDSSKNRHLGMITMELAEPTYTELAALTIGEDTYINGCQYAIAQTLILFLKSKKLNFDCHAGNVLASTMPNNPGTVLIDFGRVLDLNKDIFEQIEEYYKELTGRDYAVDHNTYTKYTITDLYVSRNVSLQEVVIKMKNIIQFISYMDYIMNSINFNMKGTFDRPQIITLLQYLYGPSFRTNWGWNNGNYVAPDWILTQEIFDRYYNIIPIIRNLTEARIEQISYVSEAAIKRRVTTGEIATFNENINDYNRSKTIPLIMTPVPAEDMDRSGMTSADNEEDNKSFLKQCWGKFCDKEKGKKEGGRKTYRKNKRRFVHKKIITRRKKSNKQRRSSKNKRRFVHKKINTRRKKSNKQRRTSKQKRK